MDRESFLNRIKPRMKSITIPEWGESIFVRSMSGVELDQYISENAGKSVDNTAVKIGLLMRTVCNDQGEPMFVKGDEERLNQVDGMVLNRLFNAARKLNPVNDDEVDAVAGE